MKYTKKQFFEDVKKEATALRGNATPEEKDKLNFETLDPTTTHKCIYGQMAEDCTSQRAIELIHASCQRYVDYTETQEIKDDGFKIIKKYINGTTPAAERGVYSIAWLSSLEAYIALPEAKNENLIKYIKGETKQLVL